MARLYARTVLLFISALLHRLLSGRRGAHLRRFHRVAPVTLKSEASLKKTPSEIDFLGPRCTHGTRGRHLGNRRSARWSTGMIPAVRRYNNGVSFATISGRILFARPSNQN